MKKIFFLIGLFLLFAITPIFANAAGNPTGGEPLVPCGNKITVDDRGNVTGNCTILDFFTMIGRVYNFIVWDIATPLATLALLIGGIILLVSAGNPGLATLGRRILFVTVIGIVLVFGAWLIVNLILVSLTGKGIQ